METASDYKPQKISKPLVKQIFSLFIKRSAESHKGQNGRVLVIGGGSDFYGAPVLAGLAALHGGVDLIYLLVPKNIAERVSCVAGADFIVRSHDGESFNREGLAKALALTPQLDAIVIGPGISPAAETNECIADLLRQVTIPVILDGAAIQVLKDEKGGLRRFATPTVIMPHRKEFATLFGMEPPKTAEDFKAAVRKAAQAVDSYIMLKGAKDYLISPKGHIFFNVTGNPGMTVGGTGDVLTGITAGLIAQHLDIMSACNCAAFVCGAAGDLLFKHYGYFFTATQVAKALPLVLKKLA